MPTFVARAGLWLHESPVEAPCRACGTPGRLHVSETARGPRSGPWCALACWGAFHDRRAQITGNLSQAPEPAVARHDWDAIAAHYPPKGPAGITETRAGLSDVLTYRDAPGFLRGVLVHWRGALNVNVDPGFRRRGVGRALVCAAGRRWPINLSQPTTAAGAALSHAAVPAART
jgi:GNAT superfamily N-acetyltransferase